MWDSGARSIDELHGDGGYRFEVPAGVVGVVVGLRTGAFSTNPASMLHAVQVENGQYRVLVSGQPTTGWKSFNGVGVFSFLRLAGHSYVFAGDPSAPDEALDELDLPAGYVYLSAAFAAPGDSVDSIEMLEGAAGAAIVMEPAAVEGIGGTDSTGRVRIEPAIVSGSGQMATGHINMFALDVTGSDGVSYGRITLEPVTAEGTHVGASIFTQPIQVTGIADDSAYGHVEMEPATVEGASWAGGGEIIGGEMRMLPAVVSGWNGRIELAGGTISMRPAQVKGSVDLNYGQVVLPVVTVKARHTDIPKKAGISFSIPSLTSPLALRTDTLTDTTIAFDAHIDDWMHPVSDRAVATDALLMDGEGEVVDAAEAKDAIQHASGWQFADAARAVASVQQGGADCVRSSAHAADHVIGTGAQAVEITDMAMATDQAVDYEYQALTARAHAHEAVSDGGVDRISVSSVAADALADLLIAFDVINDKVLAKDAFISGGIYVEEITDMAIARDAIKQSNPDAQAWMLNPDTAAAWRYSNFPMLQAAQIGDAVFAISDEGLCRIGGDSDDGERIAARVLWGALELGGVDQSGNQRSSQGEKVVRSLWVQYRANAPVYANLGVYSGKIQGKYLYGSTDRLADAPTNGRIKPGRGLRSRSWSVEIGNTDGAEFEIYDVYADVQTLKRRM